MRSNVISEKYLQLLACPYCHSDVVQGENQLVCKHCNRFFPVKNGIPDMLPYDDIGVEFQQSIDSWNKEWKKLGLPKKGQVENDSSYVNIAKYIDLHAPQKENWGVFLESGCGNGQIALLVAKRKKSTIVGIDACIEACEQANQLFEREGEEGFFVVGDLRHLPFKTNALGFVFGWGSLEHFPDTHLAVNEAYRVLEIDGRVNTSVPVIGVPTLTYFQLWGNIPDLPLLRPLAEWFHLRVRSVKHLQYGYEKSFLPFRLKNIFKQAGFKIIRHGRPEVFYRFERPPWEWLRALARWFTKFRLFWIFVYIEADKS